MTVAVVCVEYKHISPEFKSHARHLQYKEIKKYFFRRIPLKEKKKKNKPPWKVSVPPLVNLNNTHTTWLL